MLQLGGIYAPLHRNAALRRGAGRDHPRGRRFREGRHPGHLRRVRRQVPHHRQGHPSGERRPRRGRQPGHPQRHRPLLQGRGQRRLAGHRRPPEGAGPPAHPRDPRHRPRPHDLQLCLRAHRGRHQPHCAVHQHLPAGASVHLDARRPLPPRPESADALGHVPH